MIKKKNDEQYRILKNRIIELATEMFAQRGVKDVTMDEISSVLKISKRTLYELYQDKETLLMECLHVRHEQKTQTVCEIIDHSENVLEVIMGVYELSIKEFHDTNLKFFTDVKHYPKAVAMFNKRRQDEFKESVSFFRKGIDQGLFLPDINFEIFVLLLHDQIDTLLNMKINHNYTFLDVYEFFIITYMRGVSTSKGLRMIDEFIKKYKQRTNH